VSKLNASTFLDFDGKWVLVTGASSGIGRATAIELARHGASVILLARDEERLAETARRLGDAEHRIVSLDLSSHAEILPTILGIRKDTGPLYGMVHSAGIVHTRPLAANTVEIVRSELDVNLVAGLELARSVCRRNVIEETGGSLLFVSSIYALVGMPGQTGYCAAKGATTAAVRAMAIELARRRIRVNTISPGLVMTEMTREALSILSESHVKKLEQAHPLGVGQPEDVARAAVFLMAPDTRWITGTDLVIDGGFTAQ
jgi:NAD(P)-dependent dehydrogenase (short-subunit alcohol dehydrogenase family)